MATATETPPTRRRPSRSASALRSTIRFVAAVMVTSGVLLLADAGLTLAWQEPISAVIALREQSALADQLGGDGPRLAPGGELRERQLKRLAREHERETDVGEAWGEIRMPSLGSDYVVVEGTEEEPLRQGPGHYPETEVPGQPGTVAIAGHRTTYLAPFRDINQLERGDEIVIDMSYARFTYRFEKQEIVEPTQTDVIDDVGHDRLVLSACHPLYSAEERIIVFARLEKVEAA
jgi:sortase A